MHSLIFIVDVILTNKDTYPKWFKRIKHTFIFNELWDDICDGENDSDSSQPIGDKEIIVWKNKDKKEYAIIAVSISEEVSCQLVSIKDSYGALKKLKDLYDSHSELEIIYLFLKLFNIELRDNEPMDLASEIKSITHDIATTIVKVDVSLTTFIKALYPTYSHYLESLQASGNMKSLNFDTLVKRIAECEKDFGKKTTQSNTKVVFHYQKEKK
jgi:hypothetical protein